jgi:hypothetical protein
MRAYPYYPSFTVDQSFILCVEPGKQFEVRLFRQESSTSLTPVPRWRVTAKSGVTTVTKVNGSLIFASTSSSNPQQFDSDWQWPSLTIAASQGDTWPPAAYVALVFEVDGSGNATDAVGRKVQSGQAMSPLPPDSDSMALLAGRPSTPSGTGVAYILPLATYHAYNWLGGGSFYRNMQANNCNGDQDHTKVTMRRPGGGLGAQIPEPPDPYDTASPRQHFAHWDARFIRWLKQNGYTVDVYCDLDLHVGAPALDLSRYKLMVSAGHHEYWSQEMRDNVTAFLAGGGNYACFSGNTCFRPIDFGSYHTSGYMNEVNKLAGNWPNYNETQLLGLSYGYGGGSWGSWAGAPTCAWTNTTRNPYGYKVLAPSHWVFSGTGLAQNATFGDTDRLVGYEADGLPPGGTTGFTLLGQSPQLQGWDMGGTGAMGIKGPDTGSGVRLGVVFNCGTTDWARVLTDPNAASRATVETITRNVMQTLSAR